MIPAWENGELKPVDKLEVHRRALRHKAVSVFIIVGSATLIQRRALSKYHTPGLWANACCTHPYWEEDSKDCASRRLNEELGIKVNSDLVYRNQIEYRADVGNGLFEHELVDIFTWEISSTEKIKLLINTDEVMTTKWIDFATLEKNISSKPEQFTPWLKIYMKEHIAQILAN
jgi:isopentenyl-diphosphate delta-isomerase